MPVAALNSADYCGAANEEHRVPANDAIDAGYMIADTSDLRDLLAAGYDAWAPHYDVDMHRYGYRVPSQMVSAARCHIRDCRALLLDAGAGSGLLGAALKANGYRNIVGLDPSRGMLREARAKGAYRMRMQMALGASAALAGHRFDGILAAGVFKPGHAPPEAMVDLVRLARPAGIVIFNLEIGTGGRAYERFWRHLEASRKWRRVTSTVPFTPLPGAASAPQTAIFVFQTRRRAYHDLQPALVPNQGK